MRHSAVTRQLTVLGTISADQGGFEAQPVATVASGWSKDNLRAVVFVQERASRRVLGAASISLSEK